MTTKQYFGLGVLALLTLLVCVQQSRGQIKEACNVLCGGVGGWGGGYDYWGRGGDDKWGDGGGRHIVRENGLGELEGRRRTGYSGEVRNVFHGEKNYGSYESKKPLLWWLKIGKGRKKTRPKPEPKPKKKRRRWG